jgi:uncharacterized protein YbjQ (UPF0145 family)
MSDNKKDLTRIEDLGEFIHELNEEDTSSSFESTETDEAPAFNVSSFDSEDPFSESVTQPEEAPAFGTDTSSFTVEESGDFASTSEDPFGTTEEAPADFSLPAEPETLPDDGDLFAEPVVTEKQDTTEIELPSLEDVPIPEFTPPPARPIIEETYKAPENFADLKKFAESSSFTGMAVEGNPSFSVLIKNVRFILSLLKELKLVIDQEEQTKARLMRGVLLVPRISEFAAIFLAHKLRRFDVDIQVGLSDEIHPPKHQETPETGVVSKYNLYQNQSHHFNFSERLELSQIIVAATPSLEGHQVLKYLGVASEHKMVDSSVVEDENSSEVPKLYTELAQRLKAHALKVQANAVVGLNYQLTPIPSELGLNGQKYRLSCTGNLVWVNKL